MIAVRRPALIVPVTPSRRATPAVTKRRLVKRSVMRGRLSDDGGSSGVEAAEVEADGSRRIYPDPSCRFFILCAAAREPRSMRRRQSSTQARRHSREMATASGTQTTSLAAPVGQDAKERHEMGAALPSGQKEPAGQACRGKKVGGGVSVRMGGAVGTLPLSPNLLRRAGCTIVARRADNRRRISRAKCTRGTRNHAAFAALPQGRHVKHTVGYRTSKITAHRALVSQEHERCDILHVVARL
jgi:hypothetical protein